MRMHTHMHTHTHTHLFLLWSPCPHEGSGQGPGHSLGPVVQGKLSSDRVSWPDSCPTSLGQVAAERHSHKKTQSTRRCSHDCHPVKQASPDYPRGVVVGWWRRCKATSRFSKLWWSEEQTRDQSGTHCQQEAIMLAPQVSHTPKSPSTAR